jgi:hypothetical protein
MAALTFEMHFPFWDLHLAQQNARVSQGLLLRLQLLAVNIEQTLEMDLVIKAKFAGIGRRDLAPEAEFGMTFGSEAGDVRDKSRFLALVAIQIGMAAGALIVGDAGQRGMASMLMMAAGAAPLCNAFMVHGTVVTLLARSVRHRADGGVTCQQALQHWERLSVALAAVVIEQGMSS